MDRKKYYISVQAGEIYTDQTIASYEFEIEATDSEISALQELMENAHEKDGDTFIRSYTPSLAYHDDPENHRVDEALKDIYRTIHQLGDEVSRLHIETMGILGE